MQHRVAGLNRLLRLDAPEALRRWVPEPIRDLDPVVVLRIVLVICQAMLIVNAWDAFGPHPGVPHVPVVDVATDFPWGWPLLATLAIVLVRPRLGIPLHVGVLIAAMLTDQLRIQTHWVSLALLLVATGPWALSRVLGWAHLASLWFWAGTWKLLSTRFDAGIATTVATNLGASWLRPIAAVAIPLLEVGLGVLAARSITRDYAIGPAVALHVGAILVLRMGLDWEIFWWNVGLAAAAPVLLRGPGRPSGGRLPDRIRAGSGTVLVVALFVLPLGVFTEQVDPYLGHVVYTGATPDHLICEPDGTCSSWPIDVSAMGIGGVVIPPAKRIYRGWFVRWCRPGQELRVSGMHLRAPFDSTPVAQPLSVRCPR